jgi:hypothetical protein
MVQMGKCLTKALTTFGKCMDQLSEEALNVPIYYLVFKKPTSLMRNYLSEVRKRLSVPELEPGLEPNPGAWGLYTPGYYLFALHFRMIPLGFEPLSVMLNEGDQLDYKLNDLEEFWSMAERLAAQARDIAACRKEKLLIYFATDDAKNLRRPASERLGAFGRVVFGLPEEDVGHMSPQWSPDAEQEVDARKAEVLEKRRRAGVEDGGCDGAPDAEACRRALGEDKTLRVNVVHTDRSEAATQRHNDMSLVEWWILANAQWLATSRYSSYPATAMAWGLGPGGHMERAEIHGRPVFRTDWTRDDCAPARAADPAQAAACPNQELP